MKNRLLKFLVFLVLVSAVIGSASCQDTSKPADDSTFKVYFNNNYAGAPAGTAVSVESGEKVAKPADPSRADYRFAGWFTDVYGVNPFNFDEPVKENMRLFAGWSKTSAVVTFNLNYPGAAETSATVDVGKTAQAPADPARDGYQFAGWFLNAAGTSPFDFAGAIEEDTTVYAKWTQLVATVTFVAGEDAEEEVSVIIGSAAARPEKDPEREDYEFQGWFVSPVGNDAYDFSAPVTQDVRIYAHWKATAAFITYNPNYEGGEVLSGKTALGGAISELPVPERYGYDFTAWYLDAACTAEFAADTAVESDLTLYAAWTPHEYTVTFNPNGGSGESSETPVKYGETVAQPSDPSRSGMDFVGWYTTETVVQENLFSFDTPISGDLTLYAGWEAPFTGDRIFTYMLNYGDDEVFTTQTYSSTRKVNEPKKPTREGYYFAGWYRDAAGKTPFDFRTERSVRPTTLYAKWLKGYTFEAEWAYLTGKKGQGSSDNCEGTDLIQYIKDVPENGAEMGMSNGAYVGKLYYNGAFLDFEVTSDREVTDAVLVMRLTPDLFDMFFTDETWQCLVNGERIEYGKLDLTGAIAQVDVLPDGTGVNGDMYKRPFENYVLSTEVHLLEGENTIRFLTNNKEDHGGTFNAHTPLMDCMYLYSNSELSWTHVYPENTK
ncbi:MAG: InlB B-repeat-containing protein, partial [Lachnospiraceae bacterium]|nr:InlB B-repeat-containing protein [Lachnospiraceae bacterium]